VVCGFVSVCNYSSLARLGCDIVAQMPSTQTLPPEIAAVFAAYPAPTRAKLLALRQLVLDTAAATPGVGELTETLKWGQPSYVTAQTKSGSTVRIDALKSPAVGYAMYFHCQTTLVDGFKEMFGGQFRYGGNRALLFNPNDKLPRAELAHCIAAALTYQLRKRGALR
jgi:Domain of unknown function (DU1801)